MLFGFGLMAHTLDVKTSQYTSVPMYHYVAIYEAAECSLGTNQECSLTATRVINFTYLMMIAREVCLRKQFHCTACLHL